MKYFFVFLAIAAVWFAIISMAVAIPEIDTLKLYITAQLLTVVLFVIGFYKK